MAANADNAAISIPTDKYKAHVTGLEIPYHLVTCEMETIATVIIGIKNADMIIVLKFLLNQFFIYLMLFSNLVISLSISVCLFTSKIFLSVA